MTRLRRFHRIAVPAHDHLAGWLVPRQCVYTTRVFVQPAATRTSAPPAAAACPPSPELFPSSSSRSCRTVRHLNLAAGPAGEFKASPIPPEPFLAGGSAPSLDPPRRRLDRTLLRPGPKQWALQAFQLQDWEDLCQLRLFAAIRASLQRWGNSAVCPCLPIRLTRGMMERC